MNKLFSKLIAAVFVALFAISAFAQTYPYANPTYVPNAMLPSVAVASNVAATPMMLSGIATVNLQITGTCTNLNGRLEGTVDGTNYVTLNLYPYNATTAASAVTSVIGTGVWAANASGYSKVRVNNSGVTGTACIATLVGTPESFALPR